MKSLFKIDNIGKLFISLLTICFIFLWDVNYNFFSARYLFLILIFPIVSKIYLEIRNSEFKFIIHFFYISFFLFFHLFINLFFEDKSTNFSSLGGIIFFLLIFVIVYYFNEKILNNLDLIILIFLLIFSFSVIYSLFNFNENEPFFCGGIPNFLISYFNKESEYITTYGHVINKNISDFRLSFKELIFKENSHLGMIAPSIIIYLIYKLLNKKLSIFYFCLFLLFFITCLINSSITFLAGTIASLFIISIINFKKIPIKVLITYILLFAAFITIILTNKECMNRLVLYLDENEKFNEKFYAVKMYFTGTLSSNGDVTLIAGKNEKFGTLKETLKENRFLGPPAQKSFSVSIMTTGAGTSGLVGDVLNLYGNNHESDSIFVLGGSPTGKTLQLDFGANYAGHKVKVLAIMNRAVNTPNRKTKVKLLGIPVVLSKYRYIGSLSSHVYSRSLQVAKYSIFKKPLGWGFNRYIEAFNSYHKLNQSTKDRTNLKIQDEKSKFSTRYAFTDNGKTMLNRYNNKDGSNLFVKLITEFGIFSILLFIFILCYLISNNIKLEEKLFLMPIIITQMIRGAGYFNGGFSLVLLLMIFSYIRSRKKL